ncbi:cobalamin biosynthesis protein [Chitinispirillales bacterium ANBcel5]|uniref:cobalamin biosynthesis protein n=1 Tax=Cellulosispirillum alkaliphilum TaxID=3039283 RepID=UPI002A52676F|nr:cobalamin biosynthesis protein [Chitinispirillales bacterium ANBcel5]
MRSHEEFMVKVAIIAHSPQGAMIAEQVCSRFSGAVLYLHKDLQPVFGSLPFESIFELISSSFNKYSGIIYIGPSGVIVRAIAPHIKSKLSDPAVVCVDAAGLWCMSILSGHEGGANELTVAVANATGAEPIITTTTEALKPYYIGVGCRRDTSSENIVELIHDGLSQISLTLESVRYIASSVIKSNERGLIKAALSCGVPLRFIPDWCIRQFAGMVTVSERVMSQFNLPAVAEPSALAAGRNTTLVLKRIQKNGVTVAIARENSTWSE